jgi:hypothetical protein
MDVTRYLDRDAGSMAMVEPDGEPYKHISAVIVRAHIRVAHSTAAGDGSKPPATDSSLRSGAATLPLGPGHVHDLAKPYA